MRIPKKNRDLRLYVWRHDALRVLGYLLWLALWLGGALSYNHNHQTYPDYRRMTGWHMLLWMAIAVVTGFFLFRIYKFFTDRSLCGVIESSGLSRSYSASSDPGTLQGADYDFRLNTKLKLRCEDGRLRTIRFEQKRGFYHYYYEGNRVIRLRGLPYPINTDPTAKSGCVCSACGLWTEQKRDFCEGCRHTVIDPGELDTD